MSNKPTTMRFRTRAELRERIEHAAQQNNRSLSQEVTYRIEKSFERERNKRYAEEDLIDQVRGHVEREFEHRAVIAENEFRARIEDRVVQAENVVKRSSERLSGAFGELRSRLDDLLFRVREMENFQQSVGDRLCSIEHSRLGTWTDVAKLKDDVAKFKSKQHLPWWQRLWR